LSKDLKNNARKDLFNRMTPFFTLATTPSNQQNQQTWSHLRRQCRLKTGNSVMP